MNKYNKLNYNSLQKPVRNKNWVKIKKKIFWMYLKHLKKKVKIKLNKMNVNNNIVKWIILISQISYLIITII